MTVLAKKYNYAGKIFPNINVHRGSLSECVWCNGILGCRAVEFKTYRKSGWELKEEVAWLQEGERERERGREREREREGERERER